MIASGGMMVLWIGALFAAGVVGFFVMVVALLGRAISAAYRAFAGEEAGGTRATPPAICGHATCRHLNRPSARFCARCGRPIVRGAGQFDG